MNSIYGEVLGAVVRWLLGSVGGYLVARHVLTTDQADRLTSDVVHNAILASPIVVSIAWSLWQKVRSHRKVAAIVDALDSAVKTNKVGV